MRNLIKWCNNSNDSPQESQVMLDRMLAQLTQCEFAVRKSQLSAQMNMSELENYEKTCNNIKENIDKIKGEIQIALNDLKKAKTVRKNKMEYDLLAKVINAQPDRKQTLKRLKDLQSELSELEEKSRNLEKKLDIRRKQFYVLMSSASLLRSELDGTDNDETMDNSLDMDDLPIFPTEQTKSI